jgi:hypothetical protein
MLFRFFFITACFAIYGAASAQQADFTKLQQDFQRYAKYAPAEKIYLHTDKSAYVAGEIIWFKVYNADAATNRQLDFSKVAYVEVLDRNNKPVLQAKVELVEKGGAGSLYIPLTINSDFYTLRAYTNWMKNAGAAIFFEKTIGIINTIKTVEAIPKQDTVRVVAGFFPEGGHLVEGVESKLGFQVVGLHGKGVDAEGVITNTNGDTVQRFTTHRFGMGQFVLKPEQGQAYKASITLADGKTFTSSLPEVYDQGYVMSITDNNDGRWKVRIQAKNATPGQRGETVFLLGHSHQLVKSAESGYVNYESDLVFYIDKQKLEPGISHFTLFNKDQQPVCERLVFTPLPGKAQTTIQADKQNYDRREKVNLQVSSFVEGEKKDQANYSLSVYRIDSLSSLDEPDIASYLLLTSDLKGHVESPAYYFSNQEDVNEARENLLLTHGWRRFRWENVLKADHEKPKFIPEYRGHFIAARVTEAGNGKVAGDVECFLSFPGNPYGFYAARTDEKGMVYFDAKSYYGAGEIIVQAGRDTVSKYRVDILTPFAEDFTLRHLPYVSLAKKMEQNLLNKSIAMQAQNIYGGDSIRRFNAPALVDTFPFFGKPEFTYRLDDYKRFTTMEEVLREYVMSINVALRNGKLFLSVWDELAQTIYADNVLVLLDGVPLMNYNRIFSYDPLKVKKLDIVPRRYQLGGINFKGIASFETYQAKFDGFDLTPGVVAVDYEGLQLQREFYAPSYITEEDKRSRIPDFRSTLTWHTDLSVDAGGKRSLQFYTSDQPGNYLVVLQGFDAAGNPVSTTGSFVVK